MALRGFFYFADLYKKYIGNTDKLMEKCHTLSDYAYFVEKIRKNMEIMSMEESIKNAVDECIAENILKDFLTEQKAEVIAMSIYEYNEEYVKKVLYEDGKIEGKSEIVASIRKMHYKKFAPEKIADLLDQDKGAITRILELITAHPDADNLAIARMVIEGEH